MCIRRRRIPCGPVRTILRNRGQKRRTGSSLLRVGIISPAARGGRLAGPVPVSHHDLRVAIGRPARLLHLPERQPAEPAPVQALCLAVNHVRRPLHVVPGPHLLRHLQVLQHFQQAPRPRPERQLHSLLFLHQPALH